MTRPTPVFFDTNVLIYLFSRDKDHKQSVAESLYTEATRSGSATISTQVLQEFYVVATGKIAEPLLPSTARLAAQEFAEQNLIRLEAPMLLKAMDRSIEHTLSFWDALIVEAALAGGCRTLYSEDLQHGRRFGPLRVTDPFRAD